MNILRGNKRGTFEGDEVEGLKTKTDFSLFDQRLGTHLANLAKRANRADCPLRHLGRNYDKFCWIPEAYAWPVYSSRACLLSSRDLQPRRLVRSRIPPLVASCLLDIFVVLTTVLQYSNIYSFSALSIEPQKC